MLASAVVTPTGHELRAALQVARIIDGAGNAVADVRSSYLHLPTHGEHRQADLQVGEALLLQAGLLKRLGDRIRPNVGLEIIARVDDDTALKVLADWFPTPADPVLPEVDPHRRELVGAAGEEAVAQACRDELTMLHKPVLKAGVQRVSLVDNWLGYDIFAPSLRDRLRMLEVKTSTRSTSGAFDFYLSRNEYEVGRRHPDNWALVGCAANATDLEDVQIIGWCRAVALQPYLPDDAGGRWTEAIVRLPVTYLTRGIPTAV
jgi:hypothetical protein